MKRPSKAAARAAFNRVMCKRIAQLIAVSGAPNYSRAAIYSAWILGRAQGRKMERKGL